MKNLHFLKLSVEFVPLDKRLSFVFFLILTPYLNYSYTGELYLKLLLPSRLCVFANTAASTESYTPGTWLPGLRHLARMTSPRSQSLSGWPLPDRSRWDRHCHPLLAHRSHSVSPLYSLRICWSIYFLSVCLHSNVTARRVHTLSVFLHQGLVGTVQCWSSRPTCWKVGVKIFCRLKSFLFHACPQLSTLYKNVQ